VCHELTHAPQQATRSVARLTLFNHIVGASEQHRRHVEAECLGGLEVGHQLELDWGLDGKLVRLRTFEDAI
jgi:hypothetical protein